MAVDPQPSLRADARRNRDQIIAAARAIFTVRGPDVPMEEIARTAGVGVGTLYRRFPDRDALIRAIAVDSFERLLTDVRTAAAEEPSAWRALVKLLHQSVDLQLSMGLAMLSQRALAILKSDRAVARLRDDLLAELDALVRAAQAEGALRPDVGTGDLAMLIAQLVRQGRGRAFTADIVSMSTNRAISIMIDGLRAASSSRKSDSTKQDNTEQDNALPGRPLLRSDLNDWNS